MQIPPAQITYKKKIGKIDENTVYEIGTKGGLHLVMAVRKNKAETLGVGPHRAVARHIAQKREPTMVLTDLSKSDWAEPASYAHLVEKYEEKTALARQIQGLD